MKAKENVVWLYGSRHQILFNSKLQAIFLNQFNIKDMCGK